jgi:hypothetical protein
METDWTFGRMKKWTVGGGEDRKGKGGREKRKRRAKVEEKIENKENLSLKRRKRR